MAVKQLTEVEIQRIVDDAKMQLDRDIFYEPRAHWDVMFVGPPPDGFVVPARSADKTFQNGEQFPHHITDITASISIDRRQIQNVGLRFTQHDVHYISRDPAPVPIYQTRPAALPAYIDPATSLWRFRHPNVLSARDTLKVTVKGLGFEGFVSVGFHGIGVLSRRPYFLQGGINIATSDVNPHDIDGRVFRNDSSEPIALYDMVTTCADVTGPNTGGDARRFTLQVKQLTNGTGADWFDSPVGGGEFPRPSLQFPQLSQMPIVALGVDGGLCVSHRLPDAGWVWLPGDGLFAEVTDLGLPSIAVVYVATLGYVVVK